MSGPIPKRPPLIPSDLSRRSVVLCLGDSNTSRVGTGLGMLDLGYAAWIPLLGNGRYALIDGAGKAIGGGGYTTAQVLSELLPAALLKTPKPTYLVTMAATNNVTADDIEETISDLRTIYRTTRGKGVTPVPVTIPPRTDALEFVAKVNHWILDEARTQGYPVVDGHAALVDPTTGGYLSGYDEGDGIHTSSIGAKAIGQAIVTVLDQISTPWSAPLCDHNVDPTNLIVAPLFLAGFNDADGDGLPDTVGTQKGYGQLSGPSNFTIGYVDAVDGDVVGRWLEFAAVGTGQMIVVFKSNANIPCPIGSRFGFGLRIQVIDSGGTAANSILMSGPTSANTSVGGGRLFNTTTQDFGPTTLWEEWTIPADTGATTMRINLTFRGPVGMKVRLGQVTLRNLTALGIA